MTDYQLPATVIPLRMQDEATPELRRITRFMEGMGMTQDRVVRGMERGWQRSMGSIRDLSRSLGSLRGMIGSLAIGGTGYGMARALGLTDVTRHAREAEHSLVALGNVGGLSPAQVQQYGKELLTISTITNQTQGELIAGMNTLVAANLEAGTALSFMPTIGKAATATQANVNDLARSTFDVHSSLGVTLADIPRALEIMSAAGKEGRFELKDMAANFSSLTADAKALYMQGLPAVAQLAAGLQIAMKGAAEPSEAANNFRNFLNKLTSEMTVKNFKEFGVDIKEELNRAIMSGADPIEHLLTVIQNITKGDQFVLNQLFRDLQVVSFLKPMLQQMDEYRRIRDTVSQAQGGIDVDFSRMMGTFNETLKSLRIALEAIMQGPIMLFLNGLKVVMETVRDNAFLLWTTMIGLAGFLAVGFVASLGFIRIGLREAGRGLFTAQVQAEALRGSMRGLAADTATAASSMYGFGGAARVSAMPAAGAAAGGTGLLSRLGGVRGISAGLGLLGLGAALIPLGIEVGKELSKGLGVTHNPAADSYISSTATRNLDALYAQMTPPSLPTPAADRGGQPPVKYFANYGSTTVKVDGSKMSNQEIADLVTRIERGRDQDDQRSVKGRF